MKCKSCGTEFSEENTTITAAFYDGKIDLQIECQECGKLNFAFITDDIMEIE